MTDVIPAETARFVRALAEPGDETLAAMEEHGETHGPTTVGREVGTLLRFLARTAGATRAFEFGSGYGYSAYWIALGLGEGGEVVLTERDEETLSTAREFFERGGMAGRATFEAGDAHDAIERHDGPFDLVLIDHAKSLYPAAFEAVRGTVAPGGLVVADNAMVSTSIDFPALLASLEGEERDLNDSTRGVFEYLTAVREDPDFETVGIPLGEGVAVSRRLE
ncbi:methyltransferase [Halobacteriales archaeon QS_8_69_26]|nr:MAG: methyltransferase [Halobacteriales archaeon QS_8_69_26]